MAHKTLVNGTAYEVIGGTTLVEGTKRTIKGGKTLVNGTSYDVPFIKGFTVTLKVGEDNSWYYGHGAGILDSMSYTMYIKYSIDGGTTWIDTPMTPKHTEGNVLVTIPEVATIQFKCFVSSGRTYKAAVGTANSNYDIANASSGSEAISEVIEVTQDTVFYLSLWASNVF